MKWLRIAFVLFLACSAWAGAEEPDRDSVTIVAEGRATLSQDSAASEEEAIWDAKRNAVEQAAGLLVKSRTIGHNYRLESDEIRGQAGGFVRKWELLPESRHIETIGNGRVLHVQIRAAVALLPVIHRLSDIAHRHVIEVTR